MIVLKVAEVVVAVLVWLLALAFLWAGIYEIARARRPPGILGSRLILRGGRMDHSSSSRWRHHGFQVVLMAGGLSLVGLWTIVRLVILT